MTRPDTGIHIAPVGARAGDTFAVSTLLRIVGHIMDNYSRLAGEQDGR